MSSGPTVALVAGSDLCASDRVVPHGRAVQPHGCHRIDHGRQWLVLDEDFLDRLGPGLVRLGEQQCHGLAGEHHLVPGEWLEQAPVLGCGDGQVLGGQHGYDAWDSERGLLVDRANVRVGIRR